MAMAVTVPVVNGTIEMDGHRPEYDTHSGRGPLPIAQMRITEPPLKDDDGNVLQEGAIIELALTRGQIRDIIDMMELYR